MSWFVEVIEFDSGEVMDKLEVNWCEDTMIEESTRGLLALKKMARFYEGQVHPSEPSRILLSPS